MVLGSSPKSATDLHCGFGQILVFPAVESWGEGNVSQPLRKRRLQDVNGEIIQLDRTQGWPTWALSFSDCSSSQIPHSLRATGGSRKVVAGHAGRTAGGEEQALWTPMPAQPLTSCEALGKSLELLEPQLLHLLNGNNRLYVTKVYPGHIMALTECLAYSKYLASGGCDY